MKKMLQCHQCQKQFERNVHGIEASRLKHDGDRCKPCIMIEARKRAGETVRMKYKGKKLEEMFSPEKAAKIRATLSEQRMGEKNHNYKGAHQKLPIRTGSLESQFGKAKADLIKAKLSKATKGTNNPMYGRPAPKGSGVGISGHYKEHYFRSLMELFFILYLEDHQIEFLSCDGRKEFLFKYEIDGSSRTYYPDFYLPASDELIEVKPKRKLSTKGVLEKSQAVINEGRKFRFVTEDSIMIDSKRLKELIDSSSVKIDDNKLHYISRHEK